MKTNDEFFIDNSIAIIQELETKTVAELAEIKATAEKDIKAREKITNEDVAEIKHKALNATELAVKTLKSNKARNLESEQKRMILMEKQVLIKKVLEKTHNYFMQLKSDVRFVGFMVKMLEKSLVNFKGAVKISSNPTLVSAIEKYMKDHPGHEFTIQADEKLDGFILSDLTGHIVCDNSLEGIWRNRREDIVRHVNADVDALASNLEYCRTLGQTCELKI